MRLQQRPHTQSAHRLAHNINVLRINRELFLYAGKNFQRPLQRVG